MTRSAATSCGPSSSPASRVASRSTSPPPGMGSCSPASGSRRPSRPRRRNTDTAPVLVLEHPVRTPRLLLRPIDAVGDVDAIHAYASREDVCRYIPWTPKSREEVAAWLPRRDTTTIPAPGSAASLAVTLLETGELIGDVMLIWHSDENRTAEIGYVVSPDHAGHGYA